MVAPSNDPRPSNDRSSDRDIASIVDAAFERVLNSQIYLYEATDALTGAGIAEIAMSAWATHLGSKDLVELCFKIRASVENGKTPADCDHVAIELYKGGSYLGAAWMYFDKKTLAGQNLTDPQVEFVKRFIIDRKPDAILD